MELEIPGYEIEGQIGSGGFGHVFRAKNKRTNQILAIKLANGDGKSKLVEEAHTLEGLMDKNIVSVKGVHEINHLTYMIMEYMAGGSLRERVGRLEKPENTIIDILSGLDYLHGCGIVHGDIKPENILFDEDDTAKLADFGLSRTFTDQEINSFTRSQEVLGSSYYIAPEVMEGQKPDFRSDIFSLGVTLYEMMTGEKPVGAFESTGEQVMDRVILKCLQRKPGNRYQSVGEIMADLEDKAKEMAVSSVVEAKPFFPSERPKLGIFSKAMVGFLALGMGVLSYKGIEYFMNRNLNQNSRENTKIEETSQGYESQGKLEKPAVVNVPEPSKTKKQNEDNRLEKQIESLRELLEKKRISEAETRNPVLPPRPAEPVKPKSFGEYTLGPARRYEIGPYFLPAAEQKIQLESTAIDLDTGSGKLPNDPGVDFKTSTLMKEGHPTYRLFWTVHPGQGAILAPGQRGPFIDEGYWKSHQETRQLALVYGSGGQNPHNGVFIRTDQGNYYRVTWAGLGPDEGSSADSQGNFRVNRKIILEVRQMYFK